MSENRLHPLEQVYGDLFDGDVGETSYLSVNGSSYTYYLKPSRSSLDTIRPRLRASGKTGRVAAFGLRFLTSVPQLASLIPKIERTTLRLPLGNEFDAAVDGLRTKSFHIAEKLVYTLPNQRSGEHVQSDREFELSEGGVPIFPDERQGDILTEARLRQQLPATIPVPEVVHIDEEYPYFIEEYISGETLSHPKRQWDDMHRALLHLEPLYRERFEGWFDIETFQSELREELYQHNHVPSSFVTTAFKTLEELTLPERLGVSQVHGDLHPANILVSNDDMYIIDWEQSKVDISCYDFFRMFEIHYAIEGDSSVFREMIRNRGTGRKIATQYIRDLGTITVDSDEFQTGLPILYLLHRLRQVSPDTVLNNRCYRLLEELVEF